VCAFGWRQAATRKGSCKAEDHNALIHEIWTLALAWGIGIWLDRVPSVDNVADLPSREVYALLKEMGAKWREPRIPDLSSEL